MLVSSGGLFNRFLHPIPDLALDLGRTFGIAYRVALGQPRTLFNGLVSDLPTGRGSLLVVVADRFGMCLEQNAVRDSEGSYSRSTEHSVGPIKSRGKGGGGGGKILLCQPL